MGIFERKNPGLGRGSLLLGIVDLGQGFFASGLFSLSCLFKVTVTEVHTLNVRGKLRRRGQRFGYTADWKKAIVTLAEGDRIELFEGV